MFLLICDAIIENASKRRGAEWTIQESTIDKTLREEVTRGIAKRREGMRGEQRRENERRPETKKGEDRRINERHGETGIVRVEEKIAEEQI